MATSNDAYIGYRSAGRRPERNQDRRAAADAPLAALRGMASGVLGAAGDIESLIRLLPYLNRETVLPTSEDVEKRLPLREVSQTPVGKAATFGGQIVGGTYTGPGSPLRLLASLPSAVKRAAGDFAMAAGQPAVNVVKQKGGNWLAGSIDEALSPLKRGPLDGGKKLIEAGLMTPESAARNPDIALNRWIDKKLGRYIQNEMATPEDPLRALAERGVLHVEPRGLGITDDAPEIPIYAERLIGRSPAARMWETAADMKVNATPARGLSDAVAPRHQIESSRDWLDKLHPNNMVHHVSPSAMRGDALGFPHLLDELRNATNPESGLPRELLLKYSDLDKVTVPQAVERVAKINEWRAAQKILADSARANNAATQVFKEYPDKGYKWVELKAPDLPDGWVDEVDALGVPVARGPEGYSTTKGSVKDPRYAALADALKYEGETMGHCVGGYCPDVLEGRARIYSLRDAKGQPHVTVETRKSPSTQDPMFQPTEEISDAARADILDEFPDLDEYSEEFEDMLYERAVELSNRAAANLPKDAPDAIIQIKGKANRAPNPEYLPFVQDFVRSGKWSDVGDLGNTGLKVRNKYFDKAALERPEVKALPDYFTDEELEAAQRAYAASLNKPGFAQGGSVNLDDLYAKYAEGGFVPRQRKTAEEQAADPRNAWAQQPSTGISNGVLGYLGVQPEQYDQARALVAAGVPSLNNADRLSGLSSTDLATRQQAANAGLTFLNGDALMPGGPGVQNQNTPGFYQPPEGAFGGVQSQPAAQLPQVGGGTYNPNGPGQVVTTPGQPGAYTPPGLPTAQTPPAQTGTDGLGGLGGQQPYRPPSVYAPAPQWDSAGSWFPINYNPARIADLVSHLQSQMYV